MCVRGVVFLPLPHPLSAIAALITKPSCQQLPELPSIPLCMHMYNICNYVKGICSTGLCIGLLNVADLYTTAALLSTHVTTDAVLLDRQATEPSYLSQQEHARALDHPQLLPGLL